MPVVNLDRIMHTASRMHLQLHHFARGTYPEAAGEPSALPLNRFFSRFPTPTAKRVISGTGTSVFHSVPVVRTSFRFTTWRR